MNYVYISFIFVLVSGKSRDELASFGTAVCCCCEYTK